MSNYKKYFIQTVQANFPDHWKIMMQEVENHFELISVDTQFARTSHNPIDRRLDFCAYFLALIKTLETQGESFETIRNVCLETVKEYVRPKNKLQQFFRKLPPQLLTTRLASIFLKYFNKQVSKNSNPAGFIANIITNKQDTYGFGYGIDIVECGVCKLFQKHNRPQYASILCEVDAITSNFAGLELIRKGTIALGARKCDFRFKRIVK